MSNNRRHPRVPMSVTVKISHPEFGEKIVKTKNISDSGLFVVIDPSDMPPLDTVITGQVQGMIDDPPIVQMRVVRTEKDGIGLQFIQNES